MRTAPKLQIDYYQLRVAIEDINGTEISTHCIPVLRTAWEAMTMAERAEFSEKRKAELIAQTVRATATILTPAIADDQPELFEIR